MPCTVRARLLEPPSSCREASLPEPLAVLTWQKSLSCQGEQHVDLSFQVLQGPQLWWPIHMGAQVRTPRVSGPCKAMIPACIACHLRFLCCTAHSCKQVAGAQACTVPAVQVVP